ncbi:hypothetical protein QR680_001459 [Steinernema hermaphroditum]|uniref:Uncharacterized protein n=1 Tax=Steinernema hermaphroditum TaxID=289476 RepID=A0AA39GYC9_9BILA|nr:hypothetical protein QR680_001459 [Steinernema hermaphroditum]
MGTTYSQVPQDPEDLIRDSPKLMRLSPSHPSYFERHPVIRKPVHADSIGALAPVRPGMVLTGSRDKIIALNNVDTGECVMKWYGHEKEVTKVQYRHAAGKHFVVSGSRDCSLRVWQFNVSHSSQVLEGHTMSVMGLSILDESKLISGARDTTLRLWDMTQGTCIRTVKHSRNLVTHICHSIQNNIIVQSSEDKEMKIWDCRDLNLVAQMPKKRHIQSHCDLSPDGMYCLSSSNGFNGDGCEITLWDVRQRKMIREYRGHEESVTCAMFLPQQITWKRLLLSVSADNSTRIWNVDDGACLWSEDVGTKSDLLSCVGFNDGNIVVSGNNATLCHLTLLGKAGRPILHKVSIQSLSSPMLMNSSQSGYQMSR